MITLLIPTKRKQYVIAFVLGCFGFLIASQVSAATLYIFPREGSFAIGEEVILEVLVNSEGESINAAEATVNWQNNGTLEYIGESREASVFNFWLQEPELSEERDALNFTGGTSQGVSGESLSVARLTFRVTGSGNNEFSISNAAVAASDGRGTNVLSGVEGAIYQAGTTGAQPHPAPSPTSTPPVVNDSPEGPQVPEAVSPTPPPAATQTLPPRPEVRVPLYANQEAWHNHLGDLIALWEVPAGVTGVAAVLDRQTSTTPTTAEPQLVNGKNFGVLAEDGIWYIHVRFRNAVGWGPVSRYQVAVDTAPPSNLEVGLDRDSQYDPAPRVTVIAQDGLSGIMQTRVSLDERRPFTTTEESFGLAREGETLLPGDHQAVIQVFDNAGNSVQETMSFTILPLATPFISFVDSTLSASEVFIASGRAAPGNFVGAKIYTESGRLVRELSATVNAAGEWELSLSEPLAPGRYYFTVAAQNEVGARSFPSNEQELRVRAPIAITIAGVELGWLEIIFGSILILITLINLGVWFSGSILKS